MGVGAIATYLLADEAEHYRVRSLLDRRKKKILWLYHWRRVPALIPDCPF